VSGTSARTATPCAPPDPHGLDRLPHQLPERHLLDRPADVAGVEPRELEQIVDQHAERVDVRAHAAQVPAARLGILDDVVADRVGEKAAAR
jgi:hypothetical protein